jgi:hypothetical protein
VDSPPYGAVRGMTEVSNHDDVSSLLEWPNAWR